MSDDDKENQNWEDSVQLEGLSDFSKLIEVLRAKFVSEKQFSQLKTDEEKIRFCLAKPDVKHGFEKFINNSGQTNVRRDYAKSEDKAQKLRLEGNKCFKSKKYNDALQFYSKALLVATFPEDGGSSSDAQELPLAFANRSAVLFQLNMFADCLQNVEHAIEFGYPSNQRHTLVLRKALCLKALDRHAEAREALAETFVLMEDETDEQIKKLNDTVETGDEPALDVVLPEKPKDSNNSYRKFMEASFESFDMKPKERPEEAYHRKFGTLHSPTSKLPAASDWVKATFIPGKGRSLRARRDVIKDETVIVERPFACTLNPQFYDIFCHYCCEELGKRLYPCHTCAFVAFCSRDCFEKGWSAFHEKECEQLGVLHSAGVLRLALRVLIVAGVEKALSVVKEAASKQDTDNGTDKQREKKKPTTDYHSVFNLIDHSKELNYLVSARQALAACFLSYIASEKCKLISADHEDYFTFGGLLLKHIHQISVNSVVMFNQPIVPGPHDITGIDVRNQVIGTAVYPTIAMLNHSCIANTENFYIGSTIYLKTKRAIAANEEITFSYGPSYKRLPREERISTLKNQYYFHCDCEGCNDQKIDKFDEKAFYPVLAEAFYCKCRGPLLINTPTEGKCIKCGETTSDVSEYLERVDAAKKLMNVGKALIQFGRGQESEKQYLKAINNLSKICYPENRLLIAANTEVVNCYIFMENMEAARKHCEEANRIKKLVYGADSSEYLHGVLQLLNLRWADQKKFDKNAKASTGRTTSMNKRLVSKLIQESEETAKLVKDTVRGSETRAGLVLLDSSLVSCLKELVELEKNRKAYS